MKFNRPLALFSLALASLAASSAAAQDFRPDLGQTLDTLLALDSTVDRVPTLARERTRYPVIARAPLPLLDRVPGQPFLALDPPPRSAAYWKFPLYAALGFPRDAIDGIFGVVSYVPGASLPVVGVYELTPLQFIMRDPRDWHRWGGRPNANNHGWLPAKRTVRDGRGTLGLERFEGPTQAAGIDRPRWGFFPTAHQVEFAPLDEKEIARRRAENDRLEIELQALNRQIAGDNRRDAVQLVEARAAADRAIEAGEAFEAVTRALPYAEALPADETGAALLATALAMYGDEGPEWVRPFLWHHLLQADDRILSQAATLLARAHEARPGSRTLAEARAFAHTRRGRPGEAFAALASPDLETTDDPRRLRVAFEAALAADRPGSATLLLARLESADPDGADLPLARLRLDLGAGRAAQAAEGLAAMLEADPADASVRYYLGCAELRLIPLAERPEPHIRAAFNQLERATLSAPPGPLRDRAARALSFARVLADEEVAPRRSSSADNAFGAIFPTIPPA